MTLNCRADMTDETAGALDEMGWSEVASSSRLVGVAVSLLTLLVGGLYWVCVWVLSGVVPFAPFASRVRQWPRRKKPA